MELSSISCNLKFSNYANRIIEDFEVKNENYKSYEPTGFKLIFMIKNLSCNYSLKFENESFNLKLNYEIDDEKHPNLRKKFYENFGFLNADKRFSCQDENSIVLKSEIDDKLIERACIIFSVEQWKNSYFFSETKIALEEIVSIVFEEFKFVMSQIWKTIDENFESLDFSKLPFLSNGFLKEDSTNINEDNFYNLPPIIKIYFDSYINQKLRQDNTKQIALKRNKNWLQRIYIFLKKISNKKQTSYELYRNSETARYNYKRN